MRRRFISLGQPMAERPVQRAAIDMLMRFGFRAVHVPNGAHLAGDKLARVKQIAALKKDGMSPGFPDLIVFGKRPGEIGFIECKHEDGGVISDEQYGWRDFLVALGWNHAFIRLPEQALDAVREWGWTGRVVA
jgi:hypothetical protein